MGSTHKSATLPEFDGNDQCPLEPELVLGRRSILRNYPTSYSIIPHQVESLKFIGGLMGRYAFLTKPIDPSVSALKTSLISKGRDVVMIQKL